MCHSKIIIQQPKHDRKAIIIMSPRRRGNSSIQTQFGNVWTNYSEKMAIGAWT